MKIKIRILFLLAFFGLFFTLSSCEKDLYDEQINRSTAKKISMNDLEFKQNSKLMIKVNDLKK